MDQKWTTPYIGFNRPATASSELGVASQNAVLKKENSRRQIATQDNAGSTKRASNTKNNRRPDKNSVFTLTSRRWNTSSRMLPGSEAASVPVIATWRER